MVANLNAEVAALKGQMLALRGQMSVLSRYDSLRTSEGPTWSWLNTDNRGKSPYRYLTDLLEAERAKEKIPVQDTEPEAPPVSTSDDEPPKKP
jgi:hypothetical protein